MPSWRELAADGQLASLELFTNQRWRSFASRAYFAVYAEVTHGLRKARVTMPTGKSNPNHTTLAALVRNYLTALDIHERSRLARIIRTLYQFRITADYRPEVTLERADARIAIGMMTKAFAILKGVP